jgi:hypothetical protein
MGVISVTDTIFEILPKKMKCKIVSPTLIKGLGVVNQALITRTSVTTLSVVYEDNNSARLIANSSGGGNILLVPTMTARNRHFAVEYHWFREHLHPGIIEVRRIDTKGTKG